MNTKELLNQLIDTIKDTSFGCNVNASCGLDGYSAEEELLLSKEEIYFLLDEQLDSKDVFAGKNLKRVDVESRLEELAYDASWPDGTPDEDDENYEDPDNFSYWGTCYHIEPYLNAYVFIIEKILSGDITEDNLDFWLSYFEDSSNYDIDIEDWDSEK